VNFVRLDCSPLKHSLVAHCSAWQNKLTTLLNTNAFNELTQLHEMFATKTLRLKSPPKDLDQLVETVSVLQQLQTDSTAIEAQFNPIHEQYQILEKYEVAVKDDEKMLLETLAPSWQQFQVQIQESEQDLREQKTKFKADILTAVDEFSRTVSIIKEDFNLKGPFNASFGVENALLSIGEYSSQIEASLRTQASLKKGLNVFKIDQVLNKDMEGLHSQLDSLKQVWYILKRLTK
jgi:dynein heavy chain